VPLHREVKKAVPEMKVIASGMSYLRQFSENQAAGMVGSGAADMAGFGREAFAYPEFARDILERGEMDTKKCCVACGKCTELMRAGSTAGCAVRDPEYTAIYMRDVLKRPV
jgi:2,4-dienoyl-CoA reductase-like NADH-dependent reductase (Old Yellow Enzyme family)